MTREEIQDHVKQALVSVAPETASIPIAPDGALREQVDLDSMDFLRFVLELHRRFGIEVPESDYQKLATLNGAFAYVAEHLGVPST